MRDLRRRFARGSSSIFAVTALSLGAALAMPNAPLERQAEAAFPPSAEGSHVAAATDHAEATRAALVTMAAGGNAIDGAIAAVLTLGVVNPLASGLGGGGFALVYSAKDKKVYALDFRESAPGKVDVAGLVARDGKEDPKMRGVSVGVPGEPAGLEWLSKHFAKRTLAQDAAPAAHVASHGFPLGRNAAELLAMPMVRDEVAVSKELSDAFYPSGTSLPFGTTVKRADLAKTIARFGAEGAAPFYTGDIAAAIVKAANGEGGTLTAKDLAAYKVQEREPLSRTLDGKTVYTMGAPSAGGLMLLEVLQMYASAPERAKLEAMGFGSSAELHVVAEAMRGAVADRVRFASDPEVDPAVTAAYEAALDPKQMEARRKRIDLHKTTATTEWKTREHGTSHVIVTDDEGNVVSLTTTVNGAMGARIVADGTGVLLNNELDDFSSPADVSGFGVVGLGPNRPRALARPVSSMTPVIVMEDGAPILAIGGSGGERIATGVTQAAIARLVFGLDPSTCVSAPRVHVGSGPTLVPDADIPEDVIAGLKARGEQIKAGAMARPAVQMIAWEGKGDARRILAASDPRKMGFAAAR